MISMRTNRILTSVSLVRAAGLWNQGRNTADIAHIIEKREEEVCAMLPLIRKYAETVRKLSEAD